MKHFIKMVIQKTGYAIVRAGGQMGLPGWARDAEFEEAAAAVEPYTLLGRDRLFTLWQMVQRSKVLPGSLAQVGVFRGGSARLIGYAKKGNTEALNLFDTFEGMPAVDATVDLHKKGDFQDTSLESVKKLFTDVPETAFYKGIFPETVGPVSSQKFSFVYIDVDIYKSVLDSLNFFYPRLVPGGTMVFDDYKGKHTPGVKKALDEFLADKKEVPFVTAIAQCAFIKLP